MRVDVKLDDLTEAGLAFALATATGRLQNQEHLEWSVVGPFLEVHHVELSYHGESELKLHKRRGGREDDASWFASISGAGISETGSTALEASTKAILRKFLPEQKITLSSKIIATYLKSDYPLMEAILEDSTDHFVDQDPHDRNRYRIRVRDIGSIGSLESILEMAKKVSDFKVFDLEYSDMDGGSRLCRFLIKHGSNEHT